MVASALFYFGFSIVLDTQTFFKTISLNNALTTRERQCTIASSEKINGNKYSTTFISVFRPHTQITEFEYDQGDVVPCWGSNDVVVIENVSQLSTSFFVWYFFKGVCFFVTVVYCAVFFI
ncbi:MAG: hypothetical protein Terrestrivirus4_36 [Terrestrivirus sp.]|uniref:Uncharacterized protein n=1 Tax=Terrestrivirus sp. TaxID=2487775 RepID=A0A3G4ZMC1_9VIRU|nr:MAG: hypothetical protein Terrestrivirus4_36 [Terrestrivirus sp.]